MISQNFSIALHPNGFFVATGQLAGKSPENAAHVRVWDGRSLATYTTIGLGFFSGGVCSLSFAGVVSLFGCLF